MISFEEAYHLVLSNTGDFGIEEIPLHKGMNRVLREAWFADRDIPPYDRVTMDGIALHYESARKGIGQLHIEGIAAAGQAQKSLMNSAACLEVMTGAILPHGTDTVIRYEDVTINNGVAQINADYRKAQNIHVKGEDRLKGDLLLSSGTKLSASEIGVGASIGKYQIKVSRHPKTMVISTGDELVEINVTPEAHQIRKSNVYRIAATLSHAGLEVDTAHLQDAYDEIIDTLRATIATYDLIILSGGVSMGKYDFLPEALEELGVEKLFHKVSQRPGKPFWFGKHPAGCTVFALPGNPVSSFMCTQVYLMDWLHASLGTAANTRPTAFLTEDISFPKNLTYFLEAKIIYGDDGKLYAQPQRGHGSGDLANLMRGDAFVMLPTGKDLYRKGACYPIYFYR